MVDNLITSKELRPQDCVAEAQLRTERLRMALGASMLTETLEEFELPDITIEELAAISGCLHGQLPIGKKEGSSHHPDDEILRTRITTAEVREDATARDFRLLRFKRSLHEMARKYGEENNHRLFEL